MEEKIYTTVNLYTVQMCYDRLNLILEIFQICNIFETLIIWVEVKSGETSNNPWIMLAILLVFAIIYMFVSFCGHKLGANLKIRGVFRKWFT